MLIAVMPTPEGRKRLILGLQDVNIARLRNDEPIYKNMAEEGVEGLEGWDVAILGPEDTARFIATFASTEGADGGSEHG